MGLSHRWHVLVFNFFFSEVSNKHFIHILCPHGNKVIGFRGGIINSWHLLHELLSNAFAISLVISLSLDYYYCSFPMISLAYLWTFTSYLSTDLSFCLNISKLIWFLHFLHFSWCNRIYYYLLVFVAMNLNGGLRVDEDLY